MFNYCESVNLTPESVELYKLSKSVEINSVRVNSTLGFLLCIGTKKMAAQGQGFWILQCMVYQTKHTL